MIEFPSIYYAKNKSKVEDILTKIDDQQLIAIYPEADTSHSELLNKILSSIPKIEDLKFETFLLPSNHQIEIAHLRNKTKVRFVLCFGIEPNELSLRIPIQYYTLLGTESLKFIFSEPLAILSASATSKKKLWTILKEINL